MLEFSIRIKITIMITMIYYVPIRGLFSLPFHS